MSGENEVFASGHDRKVVEYLGWRIGLNVCYDLRFPVWSRNAGDNAYDVMLNVASWPSSRIEAASILAHARAVEILVRFLQPYRGEPGGQLQRRLPYSGLQGTLCRTSGAMRGNERAGRLSGGISGHGGSAQFPEKIPRLDGCGQVWDNR